MSNEETDKGGRPPNTEVLRMDTERRVSVEDEITQRIAESPAIAAIHDEIKAMEAEQARLCEESKEKYRAWVEARKRWRGMRSPISKKKQAIARIVRSIKRGVLSEEAQRVARALRKRQLGGNAKLRDGGTENNQRQKQ